MKKKYSAAAIFTLSLAIGYFVATRSWSGALFVYMGEQRSPAAVRSIRDYSAVDRKALTQSAHRQLLADATLFKQDGYVGVNLGHPLFKTASGGSDFACPIQGRAGFFDRLELTWVGVGISESGHQPTMSVEVPCVIGESLNKLATIWIPMQDIVSAPAKDQEIQLFGNHPVNVRLSEIPGQWPETWVLTGVKMFNEENPDGAFVINSAKIREVNNNLLSFDWK